ncbi:hypothetical protein [uncultured Enterococcus sp.]|uniref:hypothetical protein n=1 Tax=uncultured Enterococcus sp. TaxID=167972 RepID=UPI00259A30BA|nr:hypothetical protein [uncultured Enterococcus sp.]
MTGRIRNDLTGKTFSYLKVIERSSDKGNGKKPVVKWLCECECGDKVAVKSDSLLSGHTKSCGCKKLKHGKSNKERLYQTWKNMRQRCNNPKRPDFKRYGGRGIRVCNEWSDYSNFRTWALSNGYDDSLSIDRINVNGNYEPSNCRWADNYVQANNVRTNRIITFQNIQYTMAEFAKKLNISYSTLQHRIERGWSIEQIVDTPQKVGGTFGTT